MIDYCKGKDLDYECNTPAPQTTSNKSSPFCTPLGNEFYDPANCDPGYWCGCSVSDLTKCIPQNNSEYWSGHFTTNSTNNVQVVVFSSPRGGEHATKCPPGIYCAGKKSPHFCPDYCTPGKICKNPGAREDCPKGGYCPAGSIVEIKCKGLQGCNDSGQRCFTAPLAKLLTGFL